MISFGQFDKAFLEKIAAAVRATYALQVEILVNYSDLAVYYDPARRQYDGNKLLHYINNVYASAGNKVIGLFRVDLFIPILTYIIGQAFYNGNAGIVSLYRLKNEVYGMKSDDVLLFNRFQKEVIHELGHMFGLKHCYSPACVMRSSTYIEDVDQKDAAFCPRCRAQLSFHTLT